MALILLEGTLIRCTFSSLRVVLYVDSCRPQVSLDSLWCRPAPVIIMVTLVGNRIGATASAR